MNHIMLDIETLDITPTAVILSIGAIVFDPKNPDSCNEVTDTNTFFWAIDSKDQQGRTVSDDTVKWWSMQDKETVALNCFGTSKLRTVLHNFNTWVQSVGSYGDTPVWCKGTDFDTVILKNAYEQLNMQLPWRYNQVRDLRTVMKLYNVKTSATVKHDALSDAVDQAKVLSTLYTRYEFPS